MKVFISCLIRGFEEYREQTVSAARSLGHEVIRAEDFPASTSTPQAACLAGVRQADVVVLVMGARYGYVQPSGHSATHEEYREARGNKTVLLFVEDGMTMEPAQQTFLNEVRGWDTGHFYKLFSTSDDLREKVTRALHDHELSTAAGSVDEDEMLERATAAVPNQRGWGQTQLTVVVAGGPRQQVVRPAELDADRLGSTIQREAFFSEHALLDRTAATEVRIRDSRLIVEQQNALIGVDELGTIRMAVPAMRSLRSTGELPAAIEEDVQERIFRALRFAGWVLDEVDPVGRVSDVVPLVALTGGGYLPWRTRAEHAASPQSGQMGSGGEDVRVTLTPLRRHRAALTHDTERIAEDFTVMLRRQVKR